MNGYSLRHNPSFLGRWWATIDRAFLGAVAGLIGIGFLLTFAASPATAERIGIDSYYFICRQLMFLPAATIIIIAMSMMSVKWIKRISYVVLIGAIILSIAAIFFGPETKGANRWISVLGFKLQPSEFIKPSFSIVTGLLLAIAVRIKPRSKGKIPDFYNRLLAIVFRDKALMPYRQLFLWFLLIAITLLKQPDLGMLIVITCTLIAQIIIAGLPYKYIGGIVGFMAASGIGLYNFFPHARKRIDGFLGEESYQIKKSMQAFENGGLMGTGPGEGVVKDYLPDAHTDFIFAVAGEEFGAVLCLVIVFLFAFILFRGFSLLRKEKNLFIIYSASGLLVQFTLQALVNICSALKLIPTKGMTLPFISYGGSSAFAIAFGVGMLLAFTRRFAGADNDY